MFTGIVQASAPLRTIRDRPGLRTLELELQEPLADGLETGASVAVDGVCLTVTAREGERVSFDVIGETLTRTTLGERAEGDRVHVERSARSGDEIGGHPISGHVDGTVEVTRVERPENNWILTLKAIDAAIRYVFPKGFVSLDGCSLTVVAVDRAAGTFTVHLIPETLRVTTFADRQPGDRINFEIDRSTQAIVDTVRAYLDELARDGKLRELVRAADR